MPRGIFDCCLDAAQYSEYILCCIYFWWNRILHSGEARLLLAGISTTAAARRGFSRHSGARGLPGENNVTNKKHLTDESPLGWNTSLTSDAEGGRLAVSQTESGRTTAVDLNISVQTKGNGFYKSVREHLPRLHKHLKCSPDWSGPNEHGTASALIQTFPIIHFLLFHWITESTSSYLVTPLRANSFLRCNNIQIFTSRCSQGIYFIK